MLLGSIAFAQEPATLPVTGAANRANEYITQLDELRTMGVSSATRTLAHPEVYEFSSDLQQLNAMAVHGPAYLYNDAYAYITTLDQLRAMPYHQ
jgi:hypothetical protein